MHPLVMVMVLLRDALFIAVSLTTGASFYLGFTEVLGIGPVSDGSRWRPAIDRLLEREPGEEDQL